MASIMIVDDDRDVADLIAEVLTAAGDTVDVFTCGMEAVNRSVECRYAMVIADIHMPDLDGLNMLKMIRAQRPNMPYIIMSGAMPPEKDSDIVKSADAFHYKPDGPWNLQRMVEKILILKGVNAGSSQEVIAL
jgi:CheY-like chemotaxis protein